MEAKDQVGMKDRLGVAKTSHFGSLVYHLCNNGRPLHALSLILPYNPLDY
jgi:hypothetical protein